MQGHRSVFLPDKWVRSNIKQKFIDSCIARYNLPRDNQGKEIQNRHNKDLWLKIHVGATRDDEPPTHLQVERNYYYQGENDHCLFGAVYNAMRFRYGPEMVANFPIQSTEWIGDEWRHVFKNTVDQYFRGYQLQKCKRSQGIRWHANLVLKHDDDDPIILQIKGKDLSENHAIAICRNYIFDAASNWVLKKKMETLHWCAGYGGFKEAVIMWQIKKQV